MMVARKIVAVLGASYGGCHTAQLLATHLPEDWSILLVDRNDHFNHLYALPRFAVLPEHAHKAFIPYTNIFHPLDLPSSSSAASDLDTSIVNHSEKTRGPPREIFLHAAVTSLTPNTFTLSRSFPEYGIGTEIKYDYLVYALGANLPAPINIWGPVNDEKSGVDTPEKDESVISLAELGSAHKMDLMALERGTKASGVEWLSQYRLRIENAPSVLVVGGGALGIQFATDIKEVFPFKNVTLLHSRTQLLPKFDHKMHDEVISSLYSINVHTILGERLDLSSLYPKKTVTLPDGTVERVVRTVNGREIHASMILLCTGQTPNSGLMATTIPGSIVEEGPTRHAIRVKRSLQVALPAPEEKIHERVFSAKFAQVSLKMEENKSSNEDEENPEIEDDLHLQVPHPHIFAIGDAVDAWGAINAGHTAYWQGKVAAENIIRLIRQAEGKDAGVPLERYAPGAPAIKLTLGLNKAIYETEHQVGTKYNTSVDLDTPSMWKFMGVVTDEEGMKRL